MGGNANSAYHVNGNTYNDFGMGAGFVMNQMKAQGNYKDLHTLSSSLAHGSLGHTSDVLGQNHFWAGGGGRPQQGFGHFGHHHHPGSHFGGHHHHGWGHGFGPHARPY